MPVRGQTISHPGTGETITFVRTAADTGGWLVELGFVVSPGGAPAAPHLHPIQDERFDVRAGTMKITIDGEEREVGPGESAVVPAGTEHIWQAAGDGDLEMTVTFQPALTADGFFEDFFALANAGRTGPDGKPSMLDIAVLARDHPGFIYLAKPPIAVQKLVFAVLAPIGRLLGRGRRRQRAALVPKPA